TDVLVRIEAGDGSTRFERLTPSEPAFTLEVERGSGEIAATGLRLGVEHALGGAELLLFAIGLVLLVRERRRLPAAAVALALAQGLGLAASTLGLVRVPQAPAEALLAMSVVCVAGEIAHARRGRPGLASRRPALAAFAFGLVHGLAF